MNSHSSYSDLVMTHLILSMRGTIHLTFSINFKAFDKELLENT